MPYLYRCDYCGEETEIDLTARWKDPAVMCNGCGQEICRKCANHGEFCDDCVAAMKEN